MNQSKIKILSLAFSYLNLRLGWNLLIPPKNLFEFFSESVQIKKISSMNLFQNQGFIASAFDNSGSM